MRYLSVCSGIEAATVAWKPLGWQAAAFSEIEPFPRAVLQHHYPDVPLAGDFTELRGDEYGAIDLLVGGTPCQSFSVAGLRAGMDDPRGNLALAFLGLAARARPAWVVWENVPGVLSSNGGRDFGAFLGALGKLGYGFAYRVLDAQHFGVPQRRRRVFVVGYLGDWRRAAAVLFERESLSGNPPPSRKAGAEVTPILEAGARTNGDGSRDGDGIGAPGAPMYTLQSGHQHAVAALTADGVGTCGADDNQAQAGHLVANAITAREGKGPDSDATTTLIAFHSRQDPISGDVAQPIEALGGGAIAFNLRGRDGGAMPEEADVASVRAASGGSSRSYIAQSGVRRLTPRECERLQGFSDNYTQVPYRGKPAADSPRYRALGNSMAVPVMRHIGERIQQVEALT